VCRSRRDESVPQRDSNSDGPKARWHVDLVGAETTSALVTAVVPADAAVTGRDAELRGAEPALECKRILGVVTRIARHSAYTVSVYRAETRCRSCYQRVFSWLGWVDAESSLGSPAVAAVS
jgi:hypothetical protein